MTSIAEQLLTPFDKSVIKTLNKGGTNLSYVPVAEVIARLNNVFGYSGWSEVESKVWRDPETPDWVNAHVVLEVSDPATSNKVYKHGYGGTKIKITKKGEVLDLGDDYKGAHSDAFKKAATQLGIGLDLARAEDAILADLRDLAPAATEDQRSEILSTITTLDEEKRAELKAWWKEASFPRAESDDLRYAEGVQILEKLSALK